MYVTGTNLIRDLISCLGISQRKYVSNGQGYDVVAEVA